MTVFVNISRDKAYNLKKVMPDLRFYGDGPKVFCLEGDRREGYDLTIVQAKSGFDLHSSKGLSNFLLEVDVFSEGKAARLGEQRFQSLDDLYNQAAKFIVKGRAAALLEDEDQFILSILQESFMDRCVIAEALGYQRVLKVLLSALDKRLNPTTYAALSRTQKEYYVKSLATFRKDLFLEFQPTGDLESDCVSVLRCF